MTLKVTVDTLDTVPEAARELYAEKDGKFHLQLEGMVPAAKLNEFRDNNVKLINEKTALEEKYKGVDLDEVRKIQEQARKIQEKQLIDAGQFDELFEQRAAPMRQAHEAELKSQRDLNSTLQSDLDKLVIDSSLRDAAIKAGVMPSAIDDVLLRGRQVFRTVNGKAVAMEGDKPLYGTDAEPLTSTGWLAQMQKTAGHWWPPSTGGGAQGNGNGAGGADTITRKALAALGPAEQMVAARTKKIID